uniref:Uncharacterized protein n=1 Tax=Gopherus evgoodei TaxID=1825980 RepID=A0A8C4VPZ2_9SAUR
WRSGMLEEGKPSGEDLNERLWENWSLSGRGEFLHLRVFKSLSHENKPLSLSSYQSSKIKHDELTYF